MFTLVLGGCAPVLAGTSKLAHVELRTALITVDSVITRDLKSDTIRNGSVVQIQDIIRRYGSLLERDSSDARRGTFPRHVDTLLDSIGKLANQLRQSMDSSTEGSKKVRPLGLLDFTIQAGTVSGQSTANPCPRPASHGDSISGVVVKGLHERVSGLCSLVDSAQSSRLTWDPTTKPSFALTADDVRWHGATIRDTTNLISCEAQRQTDLIEGENRVSRKVLRHVDSSFNELCRRVARLVAAQRDTIRIQFKPDTQRVTVPGESGRSSQTWLQVWEQLWVRHHQFETYRLAVHTRELVRVVVQRLERQTDSQDDTSSATSTIRTIGVLPGIDSEGRMLLGVYGSFKRLHAQAGARAPLRSATGVVYEVGVGFSPQVPQDRPYVLLGTLQYDTRRHRGGAGATVFMPFYKRVDLGVSVSTLGEVGIMTQIPVYQGAR
jgi:hypothetical protein